MASARLLPFAGEDTTGLEQGPMIREFREFILRGNLVDLAVAVVIGAAFTAVVNAMVKDIVTPGIAAIGGKPHFSNPPFTIHRSRLAYRDLLHAPITFLIIAARVV